MPTRVRSFCKINLGLAVGPARSDGFHGLTTMYQTLALCELVTVSARRAATTSLRLTADHPGVPRTAAGNAERNTAWKMAAMALKRLGITAEVHIDIAKRLPVQGGIGAGSANAAAALLGLERELGVALPGAERLELAAQVGSDVPTFLLGGSVLGLGRGEEVYPLPDSPPIACVLAVPGVGVSTAQAFRELDARWDARLRVESASDESLQLTSHTAGDRLKQLSRALAAVWTTGGAEPGPSGIASSISPEQDSGTLSQAGCSQPVVSQGKSSQDGALSEEEGKASVTGSVQRIESGDRAENPLLALVRTGIENDFEEVAFSQHPSLRSAKRALMGVSGNPGETSGSALYAALSGSGSALFGLYESQADARAAQQRVQQSGMRAILTETLPRRDYWRTVFAE